GLRFRSAASDARPLRACGSKAGQSCPSLQPQGGPTMARKLNDTQLTVLSNAASRDNHRVLPLPKLKAPAVAVRKTLATMLADGPTADPPPTRDDEAWAPTDTAGNATLLVTATGLAAIGIEDVPATSGDKAAQSRTPAKKAGRGAKAAKKATRARTGDN